MAKKTARRPKRSAEPKVAETAVSKRICNIIPSRDTERDWKYEDAMAAGVLGAVAAAPSSVDLRHPWWTIGDQGLTGSCVGWASAEGVVRYHMVMVNRLARKVNLSARFVWMASKEKDEYTQRPTSFLEEDGTSLKAAMDVCRKYGVVTAAMLPFNINTLMYTGPENTFWAAAAQLRIASYYNFGKNLNQWKSWLASHGPILVGVSVDSTWDNATATHGNLDTFLPNTVRGGHAVALVGYTATGRFIIRNSWGTAWGDKGFGYASPAYISGAFFNESYGVTV